MTIPVNRIFVTFFIIFTLTMAGCASVPKEVVELSYTVGQDLTEIQSSYKELIRTHFTGLRTRTTNFLDNKWNPTFIKDFITRGDLVGMAQGTDPVLVLQDVQDWAEVALEQIDAKKKALLDPINKDETALLNSVDESFTQLIRANATITAHLNSIRKVKAVQDEALKALKLKDLRDQINTLLVTASEKSKAALDKLDKAKTVIKDLGEKKEIIENKLNKGENTNE